MFFKLLLDSLYFSIARVPAAVHCIRWDGIETSFSCNEVCSIVAVLFNKTFTVFIRNKLSALNPDVS